MIPRHIAGLFVFGNEKQTLVKNRSIIEVSEELRLDMTVALRVINAIRVTTRSQFRNQEISSLYFDSSVFSEALQSPQFKTPRLLYRQDMSRL